MRKNRKGEVIFESKEELEEYVLDSKLSGLGDEVPLIETAHRLTGRDKRTIWNWKKKGLFPTAYKKEDPSGKGKWWITKTALLENISNYIGRIYPTKLNK